MSHVPQISIAFQTDKPLAEYGPLARLAEDAGFDAVTVYNDLFYQPAWLPLLAIAQTTRRVALGPAAVNPFTCHPINMAGHIALIDEASGGRAYFGIARGAWLDALGLHPTRPIPAIREALEIVAQLLAGDTGGYDGEVFPGRENGGYVKIGTEWIELGGQKLPARASLGLLTQPVSCIGLPVATVPLWGLNPQAPHLPIGVQLIAAPWREDLVLRVAAALEAEGVCSAPVAQGL